MLVITNRNLEFTVINAKIIFNAKPFRSNCDFAFVFRLMVCPPPLWWKLHWGASNGVKQTKFMESQLEPRLLFDQKVLKSGKCTERKRGKGAKNWESVKMVFTEKCQGIFFSFPKRNLRNLWFFWVEFTGQNYANSNASKKPIRQRKQWKYLTNGITGLFLAGLKKTASHSVSNLYS